MRKLISIAIFLIFSLLLFPKISDNNALGAVPASNQQLIDSLTLLNQAVKTKVNNDVDLLAEIFKETKSYERSASWWEGIDLFITYINSAVNLVLNTISGSILTPYGAISSVLAVHSVNSASDDLWTTIYLKDNYASYIKDMLDDAENLAHPSIIYSFDYDVYKEMIKWHLSLGEVLRTPLRTNELVERTDYSRRRIVDLAIGSAKFKRELENRINDFIIYLENNPLPPTFPIDDVVTAINNLKVKIDNSKYGNTDFIYTAYLKDGKSFQNRVNLGFVKELSDIYYDAKNSVDKDIRDKKFDLIPEFVSAGLGVGHVVLKFKYATDSGFVKEVTTIMETGEKATGYINDVTYVIKQLDQTNAKEMLVGIPQVMMFALPEEWSNLWIVLDDNLNALQRDITDPPTISVTYPTDDSTVSDIVSVTTDANDNMSINKVQFYLDNVLKLTDSSSPYSWSWDTISYSNGSYSLMAKAYDLASNEGVSPTVTVTVNNTSGNNPPNTPAFLAQYKSDGSTGLGFGGITDERTVVLKGDVTDPDGDWVSLDVEVRLVGTVFYNSPNCSSSGTVVSGGTAAMTCSALADGQYHWQARAKDSDGAMSGWLSAGGNSESNADFIVSAGSTVINYPPSVTIILPNGGEALIAGSSYEIKWIATDDQNVELVTLYYSTDGGNNWTGIPGAVFLDNPGSYQWTVPNISSTTTKVKAIAFDGELTDSDISNSNFSIVSSCATPFTPFLQSIAPSGSSYTVSWTVVSDITQYNLQQDTSSSFTSPSVVYTSNGTSWYSGEKLSGTYYYHVKAINSCGESGWSNTQSVTIQADQGPGAITALYPADNAMNQPLSVTLSWSASHPGGESLRYNVYVVPADTTIFYPNNIQSHEQTGTTFAVSNLPYNTVISWGIEAIDDTGDRRYSQMFHFTTIGDSTAPTDGSIIINNGDASTVSYSVTLNLSATDSDSGVRYMRFSNDGASWTYWKPYGSQYAWNLADPNYGGQYGLSTYTVSAQFRDYEGNESGVYQDSITKEAGTPGQILLKGEIYEVIQDAIDAASPGDTVYLTDGIFSFQGNVIPTNYQDRTVGIEMKPGVTLMGAGADKTVIDVRGFAFAAIIDADNSVIEGLTIINSGSLSGRYVVLVESDSSTLRNSIIKGGGWEGAVRIGRGYAASNAEISNNLIVNNEAGIWLNSGSNISILNNTIANNTRKGFFGYLGSAQMDNNIITKNEIGVDSYNNPYLFRNNDVYDNDNTSGTGANYDGIPDQTGINGNISSDPSFVDPSGADYHLNSGSPCINTGTNVGIPYNGSAPDMGAYEYNGTGTIQVISNRTDASFTITGPAGSYPGSGTSWSMSDLPLGIYTVTFVPIANLYLPQYQASMLYSGQTLIFDGTYLDDTVGPSGTISVNFEEYATADNIVTITFNLIDEVGGLGDGSEMMFSNDGVTWSPVEPYSSIKKDWDLTLYGGDTTSGVKTVYAQVSDLLGNWSTLTDTILYVPDRQVLEVPTQYSTIQAAIDAAGDGDMVYVYPGTYTERVILRSGVRLQGSGSENTIINGTSIPDDVSIIAIIAEANTTIDGFTIGPVNGANGIICNNSCIVSNNKILVNWSAIANGNGNGKVIIRNNINKGNIDLGNNCLSCLPLKVVIENNVITNATRGIYLYGNQLLKAHIELRNNIFISNTVAINDVHSDTTRQHFFPSFNTYWNNTNNFAGNIDEMGPGDMESDPMFVDVSNNDFHLLNGSPSINSGDPEAKYNDPDGTGNDRGAYGGPTLNTPPESNFSIEPSQGSIGTIFTFDGSLSHDGETEDERLQVRWDIDGDGTYDTVFSTNKMFIHQYNSLGTFNVTLQVKDKGGYISTTTNTVNVINQSPNVPGNPTPADGLIDQDINITLRWSGGDPDIGDTVTYDVYFGTTLNPPLVSSEQVDTFYNPGTLSSNTVYYWKIVANDSYGASSISPVWYFVTGYNNLLPTADPNGPYTGVEGQTITLDGSGSSDLDGSIVLYEWDIDNDGTYDYSPLLPTQPHTYAQQGTYPIRLRVTDNLGATDEATTPANISDTSPTADFTGAPTNGPAPLTVNFINNSTGYDQPLTYEWDFDNDTVIDSTAQNPSYTYTTAGTYTVSLTVTDSDGSTDALTRAGYITVILSTIIYIEPNGICGGNLPCYSLIQDGIDAAGDGTTIKVAQGTYNENISITSSISNLLIQGGWNSAFSTRDEDPSLTVVDGDTTGDGISDGFIFVFGATNGINIDVNIEGFTITNGYYPFDAAGGINIITDNGGAITATLRNNIITANKGKDVGGIYATSDLGGGPITLILTNNIITENQGDYVGGVLAWSTIGTISVILTNNTITNNDSGNHGGGIYMASSDSGQTTLDIINTIVWGNTATGSGDDIYITGDLTIVNVSFSDIGDVVKDPIYPGTYNDLGGNINSNPLFANPASGNYHLTSGSPCIDTGTNTGAPLDDFEGDVRPYDGDGDTVATTDMGADEYVDPVPNIKANGSDGPITIATADNLSVTIALDPGSHDGEDADWWILADTLFDWYYFSPTSGWLPGIVVTYQGPLFDLVTYEILNVTGLPTGSYKFYFGVDMLMNGVIDMGNMHYDGVEVEITPR